MSLQVFAPCLVKSNTSKELGPNVQKLLVDLENNLGSILRKSNAQQYSSQTVEDDFSGIERTSILCTIEFVLV